MQLQLVNLLSHSPSCFLLPSFNPPPSYKIPPNSKTITSGGAAEDVEIRICTNRTCRRQGSTQIHQTLSGIAPPNVTVKSCGCLGRCGSGPNLVTLPAAVIVTHCATPARAAELMFDVCGKGDRGSEIIRCLEALALRKRAEIEVDKGNHIEAESLISKAIDLKPFGGVHVAYLCRSSVRLKSGNFSGALEDAEQAVLSAPKYADAYICQGDSFLAMNQFDKAEESYSMALGRDPSIRRSNSFKARLTKLQDKLTSAAVR